MGDHFIQAVLDCVRRSRMGCEPAAHPLKRRLEAQDSSRVGNNGSVTLFRRRPRQILAWFCIAASLWMGVGFQRHAVAHTLLPWRRRNTMTPRQDMNLPASSACCSPRRMAPCPRRRPPWSVRQKPRSPTHRSPPPCVQRLSRPTPPAHRCHPADSPCTVRSLGPMSS